MTMPETVNDSNYQRAQRTTHDIPRATIYATLAIADAINQLREDVVAELKALRADLAGLK